jgi:hypothetical protein
MPHVFVGMLYPFVGMPYPFVGMPYVFVGMPYPFVGMTSSESRPWVTSETDLPGMNA